MSTDTTLPAASSETSAAVNSSRRKRASRTSNSASKADAARAIFKRLGARKSRKEVVDAFVNDAGLTPAGASTYYQRFTQSSTHGRKRGRASNRSMSARASGRPRGRPIDESSKAGLARSIFKRMGGKKARKDVIAAFQKEAKLTPAGASTYYQKLKNAA